MTNTTTQVTYPLRQQSTRSYNIFTDTGEQSFIVPFQYDNKSQVGVLIDNTRFTDFDIHMSLVRIDKVHLKDAKSVTIFRSTEVDADEPSITELYEFQAGYPLKAGELNENFLLMIQQLQEQLDLIKRSVPIVSETPPQPPNYEGQLWVDSDVWRLYVWDGSQWVDI